MTIIPHICRGQRLLRKMWTNFSLNAKIVNFSGKYTNLGGIKMVHFMCSILGANFVNNDKYEVDLQTQKALSWNMRIAHLSVSEHVSSKLFDQAPSLRGICLLIRVLYQPTRILQAQSCSFFSVTLWGPPLYLGNQERYHRSAGVKMTGKKSESK